MAKRARHDLPAVQERRAQVVQLRAEGRTWDEIARLTGFSNGSAASKAWRVAIQQRPDLTVDEIRRAERERLEAMDSRLSDIIGRPPVRTTSIGRTQWDVRTCTCDVKADTKREHDPGCQVQPVLDEHAVIAAIKERRMVGESLRKLTGADAPQAVSVFSDDQRLELAKIAAVQPYRATLAPIPALALPAHYDILPPAEQAQAHIAALRVAKEAQDTAIAALPPDDDVVDAVIVDK